MPRKTKGRNEGMELKQNSQRCGDGIASLLFTNSTSCMNIPVVSFSLCPTESSPLSHTSEIA
jgi:hypothetical protein